MDVVTTQSNPSADGARPPPSANPRLSTFEEGGATRAMSELKVHKFEVTDIPLSEEWKKKVAGAQELYTQAKDAHVVSAQKVMSLWGALVDVFVTYKDEQSAVMLAERELDRLLRAAATELGWDPSTPRWAFDPAEYVFGVLKEVTHADEAGNTEAGAGRSAGDSESSCLVDASAGPAKDEHI